MSMNVTTIYMYFFPESPRNLKVLQEKGKLKISWSKGGYEHSIETKYKVLFTDSDKWEVENTNSQTVDTGMLHCYLTSTWLPLKTYRFKVVAFANNIKSEACGEETLETGCKFDHICIIPPTHGTLNLVTFIEGYFLDFDSCMTFNVNLIAKQVGVINIYLR